jgi:hypothetical protein
MLSGQYFENKSELNLPDFLDLEIKPVSTTTYNEEKILEKIKNGGKESSFFACALQMAVTGFGNDNYGSVIIEGNQMELATFFDENDVYHNNDSSAAMEEDDLTPKRILRVFRFHISDWLKENRVQTYLQRKYGNRETRKISHIIFPGAEYMASTLEEARCILMVYQELDRVQGTHFVNRIKVVFRARSIEFE